MPESSEPGEPTEAERDAFAEDFREVLRKRGVELACPACGADEWFAFGDIGVLSLKGRDPATGEVDEVAGSIHCLGASCAKCGFLSLFDRGVIGD